MKIVHVLPALTKGGGERVVADLANQQAAAGHTVTIIAGLEADPALLSHRLSAQIALIALAPRGASLRRAYLRSPAWIRARRAWLFEQDIVHCHLTFGSVFGSLVALAKRIAGRCAPAIVETYHAVGMPIPRHHRWLHAQLAARRDGLALMAPDAWWQAFLASRAGLERQVIANGVDFGATPSQAPQQIAEERLKLGIPDSAKLVVGTVGQLRDERRPWEFMPLFRRIADALGPQVHFVIAGEGQARQRTAAAIAECGLDGRVHLPGQVDSAAQAATVMDLYITLAVGPVVGLAALEAASAGAPVIARQLSPGYRREPEHWFWSSGAEAEIAAEAIRLLSATGERTALAQRQKQHVLANFGAAAMAKSYEDFYRTVLSRAAPAN